MLDGCIIYRKLLVLTQRDVLYKNTNKVKISLGINRNPEGYGRKSFKFQVKCRVQLTNSYRCNQVQYEADVDKIFYKVLCHFFPNLLTGKGCT